MDAKNSYKQIFKATSIFGGVKVFTIFTNIIRVKFAATLIGPAGVGLIGLLNSIITMVHSIVGLGISSSSVKFISENENDVKRKLIIRTVRKLVLITGSLGMFLTILFAKKISYLVFDNYNDENIYSIIIIGVAILFYTIENGELSILQGQRKINVLAKTTIICSILALLSTAPIYYYYGLRGIAFSIAFMYLINCLVVFHFSNYLSAIFEKVNYKNLLYEAKGIVSLGLAMAFAAVLVTLTNFIIKNYILNYGSIQELGYYEAGFTLINSYSGLVLAAIAKDFYPRLSLVNSDNNKLQEISNQQIEIGMLIILPILVIATTGMSYILKILYSSEFLVVEDYLYWAIPGVVFKLISWCLSYIVLAKGNGKLFLIYEIIGNLVFLFFSIFGYKFFGIQGLGIAFLIYNFIYFIFILVVNYVLFKIKLQSNTLKMFFLFVISSSVIVFVNFKSNLNVTLYIFNFLSLLLVFFYSAISLEKRVGYMKIFKKKNLKK
jgi:O-antigen/teichoic acid export membrane protein